MKELRDEPLAAHTSLKIGGTVRRMLIPESEDELVAAVREARAAGRPHFVIGRGSNVLAADGVIDTLVIKNTKACRTMNLLESGEIEAGASIELQRFIRFTVDKDRAGLEYLQSVPGNIGGAVFMNAGRGPEYDSSIADYLVSVRVFDGVGIRELTKAECGFSYRNSIFRQRGWLVLGARFNPPPQARDEGRERIAARMRYVRDAQDSRLPNAGTVFSHGFCLGRELMGLEENDARFSTKTPNWIVNTGQATCRDVSRLIRRARLKHVLRAHRPPRLEWVRLT